MTRHRYIGGRVWEIPDGACGYCFADSIDEPKAFHCAKCDRHIGRRRQVYLTGREVWCGKCALTKWENSDWTPDAFGTQAAIRILMVSPSAREKETHS